LPGSLPFIQAAERDVNFMTLSIQSKSFGHNEMIPVRYTCDGQDISPPLEWSGIPAGTRSLVLLVEDPDAPDPAAPKMTWVHWVLYNIPAEARGLAENIETASLPAGTKEGINGWGRKGYGGPCPPIGRHRYFFKLYALDTVLGDIHEPVKEQVEGAYAGHILAKAELVGTYQRPR
jgi:Raf kinase inhibitor-like YbhB/YbcL family protein